MMMEGMKAEKGATRVNEIIRSYIYFFISILLILLLHLIAHI